MKEDLPVLRKIEESSPLIKNMSTHAEVALAMEPNGVDRMALGSFTASSIGATEVSKRALYYQTMEYFTNPKKHSIGFATKEGIAQRAKLKEQLDPRWETTLADVEMGRLKKHIESLLPRTNFMYNIMGNPAVTQSSLGKIAFNLTSFPMHYATEFIPEMGYQMMTGKVGWDTTGAIRLPMSERLGLVKHFVGLGVLAAAFEKAFGWDYSRMSGPGVLDFRPSPSMTLFLSLKDTMSDDPYVKAMAKKKLLTTIPIPYAGGYREAKKAMTTGGGANQMFFYQKYVPPSKKGTPKPVGTKSPFKKMKPFE